MGDTRRLTLMIPAVLAVLGFAAPASASFTSLTPVPPISTPAAASSLAASVEAPTPSLAMGLSWSRTPTGPRPYFGARYYGAKIGRFTTVDPLYTWNENLLDPQRWNRYSYVRNNPLRYVDPDGRGIVKHTIKLIAKGGDVASTFKGVVDRKRVRDNYQEGTELECPSCNRGRGNRDEPRPEQ